MTMIDTIEDTCKYRKKWGENGIEIRDACGSIEITYLKPHTIVLNKEDKQALNYETVRLFLSKQLKKAQIADKFGVHRNTISDRVNKFNSEGISGLADNRGRSSANNKSLPENLTRYEEFLHKAKYGIHSRYALGLIHVPYLEKIGFYDAIKKICFDREGGYSDVEMYHTLYFIPIFDMDRIHHLDFFPNREFSVLVGNSKHPRESCAQAYLDKTVNLRDIHDFIITANKNAVRAGVIDGRIIYMDSHTMEYFGGKNVELAHHGTKNNAVKSYVVHYALCGITNRPITFKFTRANKTLPTVIPGLIAQSDDILSAGDKEAKIVVFDRGAYGIPTFKNVEEADKIFMCWTKDISTTNKELGGIEDKHFFDPRIDTLDENGNKIHLSDDEISKRKGRFKSIGRIADVKTYLNGWGMIRTIVIEDLIKDRRIGIYTNAERDALLEDRDVDLSAEGILTIIGKRQNIENFLKDRKNDLSGDAFCGGEITEIGLDAERPDEMEIRKLEAKIGRIDKKLFRIGIKIRKYESLHENEEMGGSDFDMVISKLKKDAERSRKQKEKIEKKIEWGKTGKTPDHVKPLCEINTKKMEILNVLKDTAYTVNSMIVEDFVKCVREVTIEEGKRGMDERYKNITPATASRILYSWGGHIKMDDEGVITVAANEFDSKIIQKAYKRFCGKLNKMNAKLRVRDKKHKLRFVSN